MLGPLLFIIYINDIDIEANDIDILRKFADDTKIQKEVNCDTSRAEMQRIIDGLVEWSTRWGMEFNAKKCSILHYGSGNQRATYFMNGVQLASAESERDIGIILDTNLKPSKQVVKAAQKANAILPMQGYALQMKTQGLINIMKPHPGGGN